MVAPVIRGALRAIAVLLVLPLPEAGLAQTLDMFGVAGGNDGRLFIVAQNDASVTVVGDPIDPNGLNGIAFDSEGRLFGSTNVLCCLNLDPNLVPQLVRLNPDTGAVILPRIPLDSLVRDLAFQPGTNVLFGAGSSVGPSDIMAGRPFGTQCSGRLITIDPATGAETLVGDNGVCAAGLAFAPDGTLYSAGRFNFSLNVLDPSTGAIISSVTTCCDSSALNIALGGLGVRPSDGVIFGTGAGLNGQNKVFTVNPATGLLTLVGTTGSGACFSALDPRTSACLSDLDFRVDAIFSLWRSEDPRALMRLDADTATPGRELIVAGETDSFIDLGATVRSEIKVFARVVSADGSSEFGRLSKRVGISTNAYPDPGLTANQEGGGNETVYARNGRTTTIPNGFTTAEGVDRISDVFRFPVGFGFAKNDAGTTRTLVIGVGIEGNYSNFADGFVEVSRFAFFSFNGVPSAGKFTFLCARAFAGQSGDFELENRVAGVGNFLAGARVNDDEIRILEMNDAIGFARYRYFDPTDCSVLKTVFVKIKK